MEIIMEIKRKMRNRSHGYDMHRCRARHGQNYNKNKTCLNMMMPIYIKQHISNIGSLFHEKFKQNWDGVDILS